MTITVSRISNNETFGVWLERTNQIADIISANALTADASTNGSITTGNAAVNGHLMANVIIAKDHLRGGNVSTAATLNVSSNAMFVNNSIQVYANSTDTRVVFGANVYFGNTTVGVNANGDFTANNADMINANVVNLYVSNTSVFRRNMTANTANFQGFFTVSNSANVTVDLRVGRNLYVNGTTTLNGPFITGGNNVPSTDDTYNLGNNDNRFIIWGSNVNVSNSINYGRPVIATSTTGIYSFGDTSLQTVDTFSTSAYRSAEYLIQMSNSTHHQVSKLLAVHDNVNALVTEYGIINTGVQMGVFSATIISGNFSLQCVPTSSTITAKIFKTMVTV